MKNKKTLLEYSLIHRLFKRHIFKSAKLTGQERILDAGCGIGLITNYLAQHSKHTIGIDINKKSIQYARHNHEGDYLEMDLTNLPFNNEFDLVVNCMVLEHIENPQTVLKQLYKSLNAKGKIIIIVPCTQGIFSNTSWQRLGHDDTQGGEYHHHNGFTSLEVTQMLFNTGFYINKLSYFNFLTVEAITQFSKYLLFNKKKIKYQSQTDITKIKNNFLISIIKLLLLIIYPFIIIEEKILSLFLKGHCLIIVGTKNE